MSLTINTLRFQTHQWEFPERPNLQFYEFCIHFSSIASSLHPFPGASVQNVGFTSFYIQFTSFCELLRVLRIHIQVASSLRIGVQNVRFSRVKVCIQFSSIYKFNVHFQARQRETSDFYEFYIHCGRPFHLKMGKYTSPTASAPNPK